MTVHDDLATLRWPWDRNAVEVQQAADRVGAEIARLEGYHDEEQRLAAVMRQERDEALELLQAAEVELREKDTECADWYVKALAAQQDREAAEAEVARLRDGLRRIAETDSAYKPGERWVHWAQQPRALLADQDGAATCCCPAGAYDPGNVHEDYCPLGGVA